MWNAVAAFVNVMQVTMEGRECLARYSQYWLPRVEWLHKCSGHASKEVMQSLACQGVHVSAVRDLLN